MKKLLFFIYLHVTLISGLKQGPVKLTIVPPNMWPFSGANVSGRFVPTINKSFYSSPSIFKTLSCIIFNGVIFTTFQLMSA